MGFYLRKSVSVGPLRFNFSGSGIGVSTGIKGFRVGMGPRGNYVHMGRGGLYFRTSLPTQNQPDTNRAFPPSPTTGLEDQLEEIASGSALQMVDSSSIVLLDEIHSKAKMLKMWPLALVLSMVVLGFLAVIKTPIWSFCLTLPACCGLVVAAHLRDTLKKSVVLFYHLEAQFEEAYLGVHKAFNQLRTSQRCWRVVAQGDVHGLYQRKINAGADTLVKRESIVCSTGLPPYFKSNLSVPIVPAGSHTLYFFPDRLLVFGPEGVGAVPYDALKIATGEERFIESSGVPSDAQVVGQTWRYVNKSGGPDRRFNDNKEIPITLYGFVQFTSDSGLKESYQVSKTGITPQLKGAIKFLADVLANRDDSFHSRFYTCPCNNCNGHIEFPAEGLGQTTTCPHCGLETLLFKPAISPSQP